MAKKEKLSKMCKEKMVGEITALMNDHPNFVMTNYMGSSVSDLEQVRKDLKGASSTYLVVKNSILRVVLEQKKLTTMRDLVDGGMGLSFCGDNIVTSFKALVNFCKTHDKLKIKAALVDGKVVLTDDVKAIANLPTREVLLAQVVGGIKAPITGFVLTLGGILRKFVYTVDAIKRSKETTAESAPKAAGV